VADATKEKVYKSLEVRLNQARVLIQTAPVVLLVGKPKVLAKVSSLIESIDDCINEVQGKGKV